MPASPLLIVGSMAFDDLDLPSGEFRNVVGGSATYAGLAASHFTEVRVVAVVGEDFPQSTLDDLAKRGVSCAGVERSPGKTFRWWGRYAKDLVSRTTLDTQLNVFADFKPKLPQSYTQSPYVLLGNIHPALQLEVLAQIKEPRLVAADTMNFWISGERALLGEVLKKLDLLVINDEELRQLAEIHNLKRAARAVLALGPKRLIVKRGEFGALYFEGDETCFVPAYPLEDEVDPTGAGDSFAGALLGALAQRGTLDRAAIRQALHTGATVASFCVEAVGTTRLTALDQASIRRRMSELRTLVHPGD
ncbi:MAG TPA: PfkB family carbohydrate kinase [Polyangiaceae bacterium]|nr:PfkB family carbohydrate kinase [Polyangiaceae bacterium]